MKKIMLFIGLCMVIGLTATAQIKDTTAVVNALRAHEVLMKAITVYQNSGADTVLQKEYIDNLVTYVHVEQVKQDKPYSYVKDGVNYVKDVYEEVSKQKTEPATSEGYNAYIQALKAALLKEED